MSHEEAEAALQQYLSSARSDAEFDALAEVVRFGHGTEIVTVTYDRFRRATETLESETRRKQALMKLLELG